VNEVNIFRGKYYIKYLQLHCKEDSNYVFPETKLRGFVLNFHIHTFVSDLYISRIGPPILLQPNRQTDCGLWEYINRSQMCEYGNWKLGTRPRSLISGNIFLPIFGTVSLHVVCLNVALI
jgi:hypothetical protein